MKNNGFSLIELLTVMVILGIVAGLGTVNFRGWIRKYELETQVKEIYSDLMNARITAMHRNRAQFIDLKADRIEAYEDFNGNGSYDAGSETPVCMWSKDTGDTDPNCPGNTSHSYRDVKKYPLNTNAGQPLAFNARGLVNPMTACTICFYSTSNPSYDCIVASETRIRLGKLTTQGICTGGNCVAKK